MNQLNQVLYIMYTKKIIHRDLKPANILIKYTDTSKKEFDIKLADYGFSTIANNNIARTAVGTPLTMAPEVLNGQEYTNKADLWSIGVIIYYLLFKKYPFVARNKGMLKEVIKNREPVYQTENTVLIDLLKRLFKKNEQERISWEEYFQHDFFGNAKIKVSPSNENCSSLWTSVYIAAKKDDKQSNNKKYEFDFGNKINYFNNNNYICNRVKVKNGNESYIIKQYSNKFIKGNGDKLEKEIEIFKKLNTINVPCLKYLKTQSDRGTTTLIFENLTGVVVLSEYIQTKNLSEQMLYNLITGLIKNVFVPMSRQNIVLPLITLDSILIDTKTGKPYLFECGLLRYLQEESYINSYYIYEDEKSSIINEKTNVLNFGVTMFKAFYHSSPITQQNSKEIKLPEGFESSDEMKKLFTNALYRRSENRASWEQLAVMDYVREPLKLCSKRRTLLHMQTINHIFSSFEIKLNVFKSFIKDSGFYKQLVQSQEQAEFISLFLFYNLAELHFAGQLFKDFTERKPELPFYMTVFNINENNPISLNPDSEYLNFNIIPEGQRNCDEEVFNKLKSMLVHLGEIRKEILSLFVNVVELTKKPYSKMKWPGLLAELMKDLRSRKMLKCVNEIITRMKNRGGMNANSRVDIVFVKFVLEYIIVFYELTLKKQKLLESSFHEINSMYDNRESNNSLYISMIQKKNTNDNESNRTVFTSFLKTGLEKIQTSHNVISEQEKMQLKKEYKIFIQDYMEIVEQLKRS